MRGYTIIVAAPVSPNYRHVPILPVRNACFATVRIVNNFQAHRISFVSAIIIELHNSANNLKVIN